jgi:hypothetical protein
VNARAFDLRADLRRILARYPGATSIALDARVAWELIEMRVATDAQARITAADLGLGPETIERAHGWRWIRMESSRGNTRIVVLGPFEADPPPSPPSAEDSQP